MSLVGEFLKWCGSGPKTLNGTPVTVHLQVSDADTVFNSAVAAGATVKLPVADMFWGDRCLPRVDRAPARRVILA